MSGKEVNDLFKAIKASGGSWYHYLLHTPEEIYTFFMNQENRYPTTLRYIQGLKRTMAEQDPSNGRDELPV